MVEDTIVAIATPSGKAGVAIVRISGEKAKEIANKIVKQDCEFLPRVMYFKDIYFNNIVDNALVVFFKSPNSFTGEDVVEIQCHGGYFVANEVLNEVIRLGARLADPGEFSKRAFLNGKMTIDQAEGIMDIINAESLAQAKAGSELINGELSTIVNNLQQELTDVLAEIEAKLDYPEYDFEETDAKKLKSKLVEIKQRMEKLIDSHIVGTKIKNGVKVAIVGKPNVGKSSLLNALTNSQKAIVTDIAGTTRDIVEAEYDYKGVLFRLFDTAGIRESEDVVEKIGIERAKKSIDDADIVLKLQEVGENFELNTKNKEVIDVFTKLDLHTNEIVENGKNCVYISSVTNTNIDKLKELIYNLAITEDYNSNQLYITNIRHKESLEQGLEALNRAIEVFDFSTLDFIVSDINICWHKIGEITGQTSNENIIDRIFQKFCLGK